MFRWAKVAVVWAIFSVTMTLLLTIAIRRQILMHQSDNWDIPTSFERWHQHQVNVDIFSSFPFFFTHKSVNIFYLNIISSHFIISHPKNSPNSHRTRGKYHKHQANWYADDFGWFDPDWSLLWGNLTANGWLHHTDRSSNAKSSQNPANIGQCCQFIWSGIECVAHRFSWIHIQ